MEEDELTSTVRRAQRGDPQAFAPIVAARWTGLVRLARSVVGEAEAEDAVQDGLVLAWQKLAQLDDPQCLRAWLTRIIFRRCLRRTRWSRLRRALDVLPEQRVGTNPESELSVWSLLRHLAPRQWAVLHLTAVEGCPDRGPGADRGHDRDRRRRQGYARGAR